MTDDHLRFMLAALELARLNLGQTWPNPSVGAVLVQNEEILGSGKTGRGGRPHAETEALRNAGERAVGATLYVTLEPCAHHGKTPPCAEAIIAAGIRRCVIACRDPNPLVNGKGIAMLKNAGIEVIENIRAEEAREVNRGFFSVIEKKRPFIALKIATSADEKITTGSSERWITGDAARRYGHLMRSEHDAILTGIGTVLADDPELTCRLPGLEDRSPVRVVLDRHHRFPETSKLAKTKDNPPVWVLDSPSVEAAVSALTEKGITRLLVEGGQKITSAFLKSGMVDRLYWFHADIKIGEKGLSALENGLPALSQLAKTHVSRHTQLPPDHLTIIELCSPVS